MVDFLEQKLYQGYFSSHFAEHLFFVGQLSIAASKNANS